MTHHPNRRDFLKSTAAAAAALPILPTLARAQAAKPDAPPVRVGIIGVGGRGADNTAEVAKAGATIAALCDVDAARLVAAARAHPQARLYRDYRKMLEQKEIEAVVVSTPDHHHFPASIMAIKLGKHVYCEKPLTHSVWEARMLAQAAREARVATQMGNQGHAAEPIRLLTEWIRAGAIGQVREVHVWTDRPAGWWPQGIQRPTRSMQPPAHLDWDLWLGPAPHRPYHEAYLPFKWRGWWDFGTGALGDIGCHSIDLPWLALNLTAPTSVEATAVGGTEEAGPLWSNVTYDFPANQDRNALNLIWYDGRNHQTPTDAPEYEAIARLRELAELEPDRRLPVGGQLFIGDKGKILVSSGGPRLVPEARMRDFARPPRTLARSIGHHAEWLAACRGGDPAGSNFEYAGPLAEAVLVGNLAVRLSRRIEWDSQNLRATNAPEADAYIRRQYRTGWTL